MSKVRVNQLPTSIGRDLTVKNTKGKTVRGRLTSAAAHGTSYAHIELSGPFGTKTLIVTPADEISIQEG